MVGATYKVGQKAEYSIREVVQWWIAPNGKTEVIARLRAMHTMYYDLWTEWSDMDLRSNKMLKAYNIDAYKTYPAMRIIPELRRNGFKGSFHELTPYEFFTAILTDSKKETLLKAGQTEMFRYAVISNINLHEYWNSIKICIRNGYHIADASMWCDLVRLLRHFGKDTHCPKYVCPSAFEHQARILNRVISKIFCILTISLVWDFFHLGYQIYLREIPENAKMNNLQNFVYELVELRLFTELPT